MIKILLISLSLTIIIELIVSLLLGIRETQDIKVVVLANCITNPVVVFIANCIYVLNYNLLYTITVAILEILAVTIEFLIYRNYLKYNKKSPLLISIVNNVVSFSLGLIISHYI